MALLSSIVTISTISLTLVQIYSFIILIKIYQQIKEDWGKIFRMSRGNFDELVALIRPHAKKRSCKVRNDVITLEKRIAITF